jgi:membrane associated rhomboid family serine protease
VPEPTDSGAWEIPAVSRREAEQVSLVLAAEGILHQVVQGEGSWWVAVDPRDGPRAQAAVESYRHENAPEPEPPVAPQPDFETQGGVWLALALLLAYWVTGDWSTDSRLFEAGANDARLVVAGEWWRCVTALTLHSDVVHVLGNAFSCAVFGSLTLRRYGPGVGPALMLVAGGVGNLLSSEWHRAHLQSVGASTALFGAIGILAATELARRRRIRRRASQLWLPLAGGIALLAMLGTGRGSDFAAHATGLAAGIGVGYLAARNLPARVSSVGQLAFGTAALLAVAGCWWVALHAEPR